MMTLSTDRLVLRPFAPTDLPRIQRYAMRPDFVRYLLIPEQTLESVAAFLEDRLQEQRSRVSDSFTFAIEPREVGFIVGTVRIEVRDKANRHGDVGYALDSDHQGRDT